MKGRTIIGIGNDFTNVIDRDHTMDASKSLRGADIDMFDTRVRNRAAEYLAVQHAGQPRIVDVFGLPRHLFARFEAGNRPADL